ncbi:hypothetical protein BD626DRAFT_514316 [Schizophyllum amplum]|uniref:Uncharacterized protein n=1 Tax=Schizophyllum amplum TaxID=97359 RepID=A0A550BYG1_9AGAR|nr:hypothetical protein BD626DRAFT_514316 [Auriculariopsis ampla]
MSMTALRSLVRAPRPAARCLSFSATPRATPWFVDDEPVRRPRLEVAEDAPSVPDAAPAPLKALRQTLVQSPHLDRASVFVAQQGELQPEPAVAHPRERRHGARRRRGGNYSGETLYDDAGGLWDWIMLAQVKEGTENRGGIEAVVRDVRRTLSSMDPPIALPLNQKRGTYNGWAMIDAGSFAVHIMSKPIRDKFFGSALARLKH